MKIDITSHNFRKQNLTTIVRGKKNYDKVKCTYCGLEGIRYGLSSEIVVKYDRKCTKPEFGSVCVTSEYVCINFGFVKNKAYQRVECPDEYKDKYLKAVWIHSDERNEPVRLLPGEYTPI